MMVFHISCFSPSVFPVPEDVDYGAITGIHIGEMLDTQSTLTPT